MASYQPLRVVPHKIFYLLSDKEDEFVRYWLAGYLEGEVSFGQICTVKSNGSPFLELNSTDEDVIARVQEFWYMHYGVAVNRHIRPPRHDGYKVQYHLAAYGTWARVIMEDILPLMGARRQARIRDVLNISA